MKSAQNNKRVSTRNTRYFYLKVQFCRDGAKDNLTPLSYKFNVMEAIKQTLGVVGASTQVDVLKTWGDGLAILRIPNSMKEKIWSALTLYSRTSSESLCSFCVLQSSPFLMALALDSRNVEA